MVSNDAESDFSRLLRLFLLILVMLSGYGYAWFLPAGSALSTDIMGGTFFISLGYFFVLFLPKNQKIHLAILLTAITLSLFYYSYPKVLGGLLGFSPFVYFFYAMEMTLKPFKQTKGAFKEIFFKHKKR